MDKQNKNTQKSRFHDPAQFAARRESAPQGEYRRANYAAPKRPEVKKEAEAVKKPAKAEQKRREKRKGSKKGCLTLVFAALIIIVLIVVAALIISAVSGGTVHQLPTIEKVEEISEVLWEGEYVSAPQIEYDNAPQGDFVAAGQGADIHAAEGAFTAETEGT